ncbi:hypothetical protein FQR65_LT09139 [Abscondita terminalis]|nr:hypothetical protein FQR65_LT09139 [Abscondita terminalis]
MRAQSKMDFTEIFSTSSYWKRFTTLAAASKHIVTEIDLVIIPSNVDYQTDEEEFHDDDLVRTELTANIPGELEIDVNELKDKNSLENCSEDEDTKK